MLLATEALNDMIPHSGADNSHRRSLVCQPKGGHLRCWTLLGYHVCHLPGDVSAVPRREVVALRKPRRNVTMTGVNMNRDGTYDVRVHDEPTAMSFTIPLTVCTIVAPAAVVTTCSASADYTDSATPTCSGSVCIAISCGGGSFTPDGAYDSLWDSRTRPVQVIPKKAPVPIRIGLADYSMWPGFAARSVRLVWVSIGT